MFTKIEGLLNVEKLPTKKILLIGLGGVGGYIFECLIRSGITNITIIDPDNFELSNLNRQILATKKSLSKPKVKIGQKRANSINENAQIIPIKAKLNDQNIDEILKTKYDFIIDACDDVKAKIAIIKKAYDNNLNLISAMGSANKIDPSKFSITTLEKTSYDPLAKKLRQSLDKKYHKTIVASSTEKPKKSKKLQTICPVPMACGALISAYVLQKLNTN